MIRLYMLRVPLGVTIAARGEPLVKTPDPASHEQAILLTPRRLDALSLLGEPIPFVSIGLLIGGSAPAVARLAPAGRPDGVRLRLDDDAPWSELDATPVEPSDLDASLRRKADAVRDLLAAPEVAAALATFCETDPALAGAAAHLLGKSAALQAIGTLHDHPHWPVLFPGLSLHIFLAVGCHDPYSVVGSCIRKTHACSSKAS